jgi:hypothetical protein
MSDQVWRAEVQTWLQPHHVPNPELLAALRRARIVRFDFGAASIIAADADDLLVIAGGELLDAVRRWFGRPVDVKVGLAFGA